MALAELIAQASLLTIGFFLIAAAISTAKEKWLPPRKEKKQPMPVSQIVLEEACDGDFALTPPGRHTRNNLKLSDLQERPSK